MSWEPVTYWHMRCDGVTTRGQCREVFRVFDEDDRAEREALEDEHAGNDTEPVIFTVPTVLEVGLSALKAAGWHIDEDAFLRNPRTAPVWCAQHMAAVEYLARAKREGLPFHEIRADNFGERST